VLATCALLASGCGGGAHQDANEPSGTFKLQVLRASFPNVQSIARPTRLELLVHNAGTGAAPNVAVTLDSFYYTETFPELAASQRPVWIIDRGPGAIPARPASSQAVTPPGGGLTAYVNTWALGRLAPGATRMFSWRVVPVKPGIHTVHFALAAGLAGKARAVSTSGGALQGGFTVSISPAPPARHVDPNTGQVVPGRFPLVP
jgi:hypothetical protein